MSTNTILTFPVIFLIIYSVSLISAYNEPPNYFKNSILLQPEDLSAHLKALKRVIEFGVKIHVQNDITMILGYFLIKVNLKWALVKREAGLSDPLKQELAQMLYYNEKILQNFNYTLDITDTPLKKTTKMIASLFRDDESWIRGLKSFHRDSVISDRGLPDSEYYPAGYEAYTQMVFDYDHMTPQPDDSDICILQIADNPTQNRLFKCNTNDKCINMLTEGSHYGYAITHRLLWLLTARLSRGCYLISPDEDTALAERLCSTIYKEAEYIWANHYEHLDLLLEQIALCSLDGHKEFFQRTWMSKLLSKQTRPGCFNAKKDSKTPISKRSKRGAAHGNVSSTACNGHITAVANGVMSAAVRYIIDTFYGRPGI